MQTPFDFIILFQIVVLVYSVVIHEVAHGASAYLFGDKTAYYAGRLTLNPLKHLDPVGSVLLPIILTLSGSPIIAGWAKPVPVNESNLIPRKVGSLVTSSAGILANISLATIFTVLGSTIASEFTAPLYYIIAVTNAGLAVFNLLPLPPMDGYRILSLVLPVNTVRSIEQYIYQYQVAFLIASLFIASYIFGTIFSPIAELLRSLILG